MDFDLLFVNFYLPSDVFWLAVSQPKVVYLVNTLFHLFLEGKFKDQQIFQLNLLYSTYIICLIIFFIKNEVTPLRVIAITVPFLLTNLFSILQYCASLRHKKITRFPDAFMGLKIVKIPLGHWEGFLMFSWGWRLWRFHWALGRSDLKGEIEKKLTPFY